MDHSDRDNRNQPGKDDKSAAVMALPISPPVEARLVAGGISVTYRAPAPPLITAADVPILHYDLEEDDDNAVGGDEVPCGGTDAELTAFLARVKSASPLLLNPRSDTSSASLPVSPWQSSRDSLLIAVNSPGGDRALGNSSSSDDNIHFDGGGAYGPASLTSEDFEPQIMTEDCAVVVVTSAVPHGRSSTDSASSSFSSTPGGLLYTSYIPDREVIIIENEFTRLEPSLSDTESHVSSLQEVTEYDSNTEYGRAWRSSTSMAEIKAFWEARAGQQLVKASSESNIFERDRMPPENGLREILKDREYTSCEEEDEEEEGVVEEGEEEVDDEVDYPPAHSHILEPVRYHQAGPQYEESGCYSYDYDNVIPEEPSDYEDSWAGDHNLNHISLISVAHESPESPPSSLNHIQESEEEDKGTADENDHVTIIRVEPPSPIINKTHFGAVVSTTNTTNPHNPYSVTDRATADYGADKERLPPPSVHCSVKDLRRLFERQAAAEPAAASGWSRPSVPDGTVNELKFGLRRKTNKSLTVALILAHI